jgi:protein O-GlcNAc transferase
MNTNRLTRFKTSFILLSLLASAGGVQANTPSAAKERAAAALEEAIKKDPNNAELWVHLGFAYRKQGQIDPSQSAFEKARALDPRVKEALYMLGLIYEKKGRTQEAEQAWKEYIAAETDPIKRADAEKHLQQLKP